MREEKRIRGKGSRWRELECRELEEGMKEGEYGNRKERGYGDRKERDRIRLRKRE